MMLLNQTLPADLQLTPRNIGAYLSSSGWELWDSDAISETWHSGHGLDGASIRLPTSTRLRDFELRFNESLSALCEVNDWPIEQLANAVIRVRSDILLLRADEFIRYDSIPIRQADDLITGAIKMITAAARSTIEPRPNHRGRPSNAVRGFIDDDVRMGHTQRGSFVVTILTALGDDGVIDTYPDTDGADDLPTEELADTTATPDLSIASFQRRVMSTLANALSVVPNLSMASANANLESAVDAGVSAELCESLQLMTRYEGLRSLDMSFKWAPAEAHSPRVDKIVLDRDNIPGLQPLTSRFKQQDVAAIRQTLYGYVLRLERDQFPDDDNTSIALVRGVIGRSRRQVRVAVSDSFNLAAISAYQNRTPVLLTGDVEKIGRDYWMTGEVNLVPAPFEHAPGRY
ncbi:hypothetical protein [Nocardia sp. Root136]|uniref:hypothetical protein n=1 Tax=Nocardia sp. Root136 TaxID=1736458 RepID=UPI000ABB43D9|nr:hypothetical protein [Nocardia sp. Root136]